MGWRGVKDRQMSIRLTAMKDMDHARTKVKPSVDSNDLERYTKWLKDYGLD